jgi:hypothetical protein
MFPSTAKYPPSAKQAAKNDPQKSCFMMAPRLRFPLSFFYRILGHGNTASKEISGGRRCGDRLQTTAAP